ncbi:MATE family efflux transporter [Rhizobium sp. YTU87027]|uniref:MATE family efflux transporter n=1 Tax=Rhizobium sp. YTU87027 TaxID=3417741 RepID=UPI003D690CEF
MNDMSGSFAKRRIAPEDLASPQLLRLVFRLGVPAMLGLSINAAHHTINMIFVGMIGEHEIAAIMIVLPILMAVAAFGEGIGVGVATEVGRALGAKDRARANVAASISLVFGVLFGVICAVTLIAFPTQLLALFGATPALLPLAQGYLMIIALTVPLTMAQIIFDFLAIAEGNARFSMWTLIACFALNIILDPLMIFGLGLGLQGVAIATILSQITALGIYGVYHAKKLGTLRLSLGRRMQSAGALWSVLAVGAPTTMASLVTSGAIATLLTLAGSYRGEDGIAGIGIALRLLAVATLPVIGISLGAQAILSFAWGRKDMARMVSAARILAVVTSAFSIGCGLAMLGFRHDLARLFADSPEVLAIAGQAIVATQFPFLLFGMRQTLLVLYQAQARPRAALALGLAQNGYVLFPLLAVLPSAFGFAGLLCAIFAASALTGLLSAWLLVVALLRLKAGPAGKHLFRPHKSFCP